MPASVSRLFWMWLLARTGVWVVAVILSHPNAPLDLIEWLSWGHVWQWGYPKHPPFPAWAADAISRLTPGSIWPMYALGYGFTALTLLAAWELAREYLTPRLALAAVVCLDGLMYFTNDPAEYSNNVVLNTGWAWLAVTTFRAVRTHSVWWWLAVGVTLGLTLLTKYTVGVLVVCLVGCTLWDRTARRVWRTPGPYLAAAVAVAVFAPHFLWVREQGYVTFRYAVERSSDGGGVGARVFHPTQFLGGQLLYLLPVLLVLMPAVRWRPFGVGPRQPDGGFLDFIVLGPVVLLLSLSVVTGAVLREIWGSPLWMFLGVWVLARFGKPEELVRWRTVVRVWAVVAGGVVAFTVVKQTAGPHLTGQVGRPHFPGRQLADTVNRLWAERYGGDGPPVVGGEAWRAGNAVCYSPHRPKVYTSGHMGYLVMDEAQCPWTSDVEVNARGAVIVWDPDLVGNDQLDGLRARFPRFEMLPPLELPQQSSASVKPARVGVAVVPPAGR